MTSSFSHTQLTLEMIDNIPLIDIHVHLAGTISPNTAWELGVRNKFITIYKDQHDQYQWQNGPNALPLDDPFEHYSDIFKKDSESDIALDYHGLPEALHYNIDQHSFKSFDRVMATVQGHRHPPGGIQTEEDVMLVLHKYLKDCIKQKVFYTEVQQNIKIAYQLYPEINNSDARKKFYQFLNNVINVFKENGVIIRFIHCFNKTQVAGLNNTSHERSVEASLWLKEAMELTPDVFVGVESAGHEKDESGWPIHLKAGYDKISELGLGCEAHGGEGIGVEHMMDVITTLPITRLAHGFQAIEDEKAINEIKKRNITLIMMPLINLKLGTCVHLDYDTLQVKPKSLGGQRHYITKLWEHPFFELLRKHKLKITLGSDNPYLGGEPIKETIKILAGLDKNFIFPSNYMPLGAEELVQCCFNGINAAFCEDSIKAQYKELLLNWAMKYKISCDISR